MIGDSVYIKDLKTRDKVLKLASSSRSYLIQSDCGIYRRNRRHLAYMYIETEINVEIEPQEITEYLEQDREVDIPQNPPDINIIPPRWDSRTYVTRYGQVVKKPTRFRD